MVEEAEEPSTGPTEVAIATENTAYHRWRYQDLQVLSPQSLIRFPPPGVYPPAGADCLDAVGCPLPAKAGRCTRARCSCGRCTRIAGVVLTPDLHRLSLGP